MKKRTSLFFVFTLVFLFNGHGSFAFGSGEEAAVKPSNPEWILCVTALDTSGLSSSMQAVGNTVTALLRDSLLNLDVRFRGDEEIAYYQDYALAAARSTAAKSLQAKRNERDLLLFSGEPAWRYRRSLRTIEEAIEKLETELAEIDARIPVVEGRPLFKLTSGNLGGTYPARPESGGEYSFLVRQKADAFLCGSLLEYHGRIYLELKMYTLYSKSYSYEDSVLFSQDQMDEAVAVVREGLASAISETLSSAVIVNVEPPGAMVMIDGSPAAAGELLAHSPGNVEIEVTTGNHLPVSVPLELNPGEINELFIELTPFGYNAFEADVPGSPLSRLYLGSLFVGETPLSVELPARDFAYISVETPEGEIGSMIYRDNEMLRGSAEFLRNDESGRGTAVFSTSTPVSSGENRVEKVRRSFYGTYGAFWVILPITLISAGIGLSYIEANNAAAISGTVDPAVYEGIYNRAVTGDIVRKASFGIMGAALGVTFFQIFRYLFVSGADSTPIARDLPSEPAPEETSGESVTE